MTADMLRTLTAIRDAMPNPCEHGCDGTCERARLTAVIAGAEVLREELLHTLRFHVGGAEYVRRRLANGGIRVAGNHVSQGSTRAPEECGVPPRPSNG